ncbi:hypothetical protein KY311_01305, partial [Candidatus Woesearchaeota archaeon]|nr:hypothetical protein [Candidatus Woesearchaeota archaeon]
MSQSYEDQEPDDAELLRKDDADWIPHVHTSEYSDGRMTSMEIFRKSLASGTKYIAVTDHDNIGVHVQHQANFDHSKGFSVVPVLDEKGRDTVGNINLVSGVELACWISYFPEKYHTIGTKKGVVKKYEIEKPKPANPDSKEIDTEFKPKGKVIEIEIIGYGFDPRYRDEDKQDIFHACRKNMNYRSAWLEQVLSMINEKYPGRISIDSFKGLSFIGKPQIVEAMKRARIISKHADGFRMLKEGGIFYAEKPVVHLDEAIYAIEASGGRCGLPHPGVIGIDSGLSDEEVSLLFLEYLSGRQIKKEFVFIEAMYPYAKRRERCFDEEKELMVNKFWFDFAQTHNLIALWASDFHGEKKKPKRRSTRKMQRKPIPEIFEAHAEPLESLEQILSFRYKGMTRFRLKTFGADDEIEDDYSESDGLFDDDEDPDGEG